MNRTLVLLLLNVVLFFVGLAILVGGGYLIDGFVASPTISNILYLVLMAVAGSMFISFRRDKNK